MLLICVAIHRPQLVPRYDSDRARFNSRLIMPRLSVCPVGLVGRVWPAYVRQVAAGFWWGIFFLECSSNLSDGGGKANAITV